MREVGEMVRVGAVDAELLGGIAAEAAGRLRRSLVAEVIHIERDEPIDLAGVAPDLFGLLVLEGVLTRRVALGQRATIELLGPGDVLRPWQDEHGFASLAGAVAWNVVEPGRLAVLDAEFVALAARHAPVLGELASRFVQRSHTLADRLAIAQIPRLDARLLALLWHLADRWGRREHGRVTIDLPLRHETLADLACAQRPPVSLALRALVAGGRIARRPHGGWELFGAPVGERELRRLRSAPAPLAASLAAPA